MFFYLEDLLVCSPHPSLTQHPPSLSSVFQGTRSSSGEEEEEEEDERGSHREFSSNQAARAPLPYCPHPSMHVSTPDGGVVPAVYM